MPLTLDFSEAAPDSIFIEDDGNPISLVGQVRSATAGFATLTFVHPPDSPRAPTSATTSTEVGDVQARLTSNLGLSFSFDEQGG